MEDIEIIDALFARREDALGEVAKKYAPLYRSVIGRVLYDEGDIDECENDLLLAVWNSIPPERPHSLGAYLVKLARCIGIDRLRFRTRKKRSTDYTVMLSELSECTEASEAPHETDDGTLSRVLCDFLRSLDGETEILFVRRYVHMESVASLAERFGMSENRVSVKLYRARKQLKERLRREGIVL